MRFSWQQDPKIKHCAIISTHQHTTSTLVKLLTEYHVHLTILRDGIQAPTILVPIRPDVIFVDIELWGVSGYDVMATLRKKLSNGTAMIAISAFAERANRERDSLQAPLYDAFMRRPIALPPMRQIVEHFLR